MNKTIINIIQLVTLQCQNLNVGGSLVT